jgi:hypothetical protein
MCHLAGIFCCGEKNTGSAMRNKRYFDILTEIRFASQHFCLYNCFTIKANVKSVNHRPFNALVQFC